MTNQPHSSWAEVYDTAYQKSFGDFYDRFTDATVESIVDLLKPPARIVDFGAGTGRLAIPLSRLGFGVTAVEPCPEMLDQLRRKDQNNSITTACARMEDFRGEGKFEMALCVFTVILYLLDEVALERSFAAAYKALRPDGTILLDIPSKATFNSYSRSGPGFRRDVSVIPRNGSIYTYRENLVVACNGDEAKRYEDEFNIRHWPQQHILELLQKIGFVEEEDLTPRFLATGSSYYKFKKPNKAVDSTHYSE